MEGIKQFVNDSWLTINDVAIKGGNAVKTTGERFFDSIKNIQNSDLSDRLSVLLENTVPSFVRKFATTVVGFVYSHPVIALASLVGMYVITRPKVREYLQNAVVWLAQKVYAVMSQCASLVMKYKLPVNIICCAVFGATILFEKFLQYTPNGMISTFFNAIVKSDVGSMFVGGMDKFLQIVGKKEQDLFWFFVERSIIDLETIVTMKSISFVLGRFLV